MSYHNLSNSEIVFIYLVADMTVKQYEDVFSNKTVNQSIPTDSGLVKVETPIPSDLVNEILNSKHYLFMKSIKEKLHPICELIKESDADSIKEVEPLFLLFKKE